MTLTGQKELNKILAHKRTNERQNELANKRERIKEQLHKRTIDLIYTITNSVEEYTVCINITLVL